MCIPEEPQTWGIWKETSLLLWSTYFLLLQRETLYYTACLLYFPVLSPAGTVSVVARYTEVPDTQRIVHKNLCLIFRNYYAFILRFWMLLKTKEMMLFYIVSEMKILSHTIFCLWLCIYILKINKKYVFRILVETLMQAFSVLFAFLRKDIIIKE